MHPALDLLTIRIRVIHTPCHIYIYTASYTLRLTYCVTHTARYRIVHILWHTGFLSRRHRRTRAVAKGEKSGEKLSSPAAGPRTTRLKRDSSRAGFLAPLRRQLALTSDKLFCVRRSGSRDGSRFAKVCFSRFVVFSRERKKERESGRARERRPPSAGFSRRRGGRRRAKAP